MTARHDMTIKNEQHHQVMTARHDSITENYQTMTARHDFGTKPLG